MIKVKSDSAIMKELANKITLPAPKSAPKVWGKVVNAIDKDRPGGYMYMGRFLSTRSSGIEDASNAPFTVIFVRDFGDITDVAIGVVIKNDNGCHLDCATSVRVNRPWARNILPLMEVYINATKIKALPNQETISRAISGMKISHQETGNINTISEAIDALHGSIGSPADHVNALRNSIPKTGCDDIKDDIAIVIGHVIASGSAPAYVAKAIERIQNKLEINAGDVSRETEDIANLIADVIRAIK